MPATCSSCGSSLPDDAANCPSCGAAAPTAIGTDANAVGADAETVAFNPAAGDDSPEAISGKLTRGLGPNYEVRGVVGRGGFAAVYEVWDKDLERRLAAKVLLPDVAFTPGTRERFKHEARTVARLNHPNILPIHFVGDADDLAFYVMPFVEGESLKQVLSRGKLDPDAALKTGLPILEALAHAHGDGLVHRDIKPDNVMIDGATGRALLVDFGIAKALDPKRASNMTQAGFAVGTPQYMSPEQTLGDPIDGRSDIYSFGVMLYEMVTGRRPFDGATSQEIVAKHIADPVPDPSDIDETLPAWLAAVILKSMEKKPGDRFQSAAEMVEALEGGASGGMPGGVPDVLGGEIVQGSGYSDDEMFTYRPPEPAPAPDEPEHPAPSAPPDPPDEPDQHPSEEGPTLELETLEPQRQEAAGDSPATEPEAEAPEPEPEPDRSFTPAPPVVDPLATARGTEARKKARFFRPANFARAVVALGLFGAVGWLSLNGYGPGAIRGFYESLMARLSSGAPGFSAPTSSANQIVISNSLVEPVELLIDGETDRLVAAGERLVLPLSGNVGADFSWRLVRPVAEDGRAMGRSFGFDLEARAESESSRQYVISASVAGRRFFSPLVNNFSSHDVVVMVTGGAGDGRCNCIIPAGSRRVRIGYYPLETGTTIRAYPASRPYRGDYEEVGDFSPRVDALSGSIEVTLRGR